MLSNFRPLATIKFQLFCCEAGYPRLSNYKSADHAQLYSATDRQHNTSALLCCAQIHLATLLARCNPIGNGRNLRRAKKENTQSSARSYFRFSCGVQFYNLPLMEWCIRRFLQFKDMKLVSPEMFR